MRYLCLNYFFNRTCQQNKWETPPAKPVTFMSRYTYRLSECTSNVLQYPYFNHASVCFFCTRLSALLQCLLFVPVQVCLHCVLFLSRLGALLQCLLFAPLQVCLQCVLFVPNCIASLRLVCLYETVRLSRLSGQVCQECQGSIPRASHHFLPLRSPPRPGHVGLN